MDDQNKNLLLATVLSVGVILIWFALFPPEPPAEQSLPPEVNVADSSPPIAVPAPTAQPTTAAPPAVAQALADAPRVSISSARLEGSLSLLGGRIDDLRLKDYRVTNSAASEIVTLLTPEDQPGAYYGVNGWAPGQGLTADDVPGPSTLWTLQNGTTLTPTSPITLVWTNGKGLTFQRTIALDQNFMFRIEQKVTNATGTDVTLAPYGIIKRIGLPDDLKNFFILHEGLVRMSDGELDETTYGNMEDYNMVARERAQADVVDVAGTGWIGFTDHYWMTTLIPDGAFKSVAKYDAGQAIYQTDAVKPTQAVGNGETVAITSRFFAGPKEWEAISSYQNQPGVWATLFGAVPNPRIKPVDGFVDSIDWGWFYFLTKPIFVLLHWMNAWIGNMGWAIIGLTLVIKAILLPLAYKSYVSMAKMKELQPEMEKLKESAKDDREKLQRGMMELYKKNKVNPASGCLPILLQIPIFFSLYKVIFVTLELRHAPFFGPFQDLSAPDPTSIMNLYGLLPFAGPEPGSIIALIFIGILPLLLGISMWLQQKLNPAPTDPTQAMIFAWMPWVFMFMLGTFASGLIVYWIANNTITFAQQYLIMRSQGVKVDVFGNIVAGFRKGKGDG